MSLRLERDGPIAHLLIDRAAKRNAFNQAMWDAMPEFLDEVRADGGTRVLVLRAAEAGSAFSAGADIAEFSTGAPDPEWRARNQASIARVQRELARLPIPTLAVIEGDCVGGGCGLAIACDLRVAGPGARLGITPAKLGLVYSLHDTKLLVDLVGPSQAKRILYTGKLISAEEALSIGLVTLCDDDPLAAGQALAEDIAAASGHAQRGTKGIIRRILDGQADDDAETQAQFFGAFDGADFAEGVSAFLEKRKAVFK